MMNPAYAGCEAPMTGQRTMHPSRHHGKRLLSLRAVVTRTWGLLGACTRAATVAAARYDHGFKFDLVASGVLYGSPDAELLDYEYGSFLRASRDAVMRERVTGRMFLYQ